MRLTERKSNGRYELTATAKLDLKNCLYTLVEQTLGQLEDIEDELGIDLITLFKALKNGFYAKGKEKKNRFCYVSACFGSIELKNNGLKYSTISMKEFYYFKDYGKTWALTKEELL